MRRLGLLSAILLLSWQGGVAGDVPVNITDYEGKVVVLDFWASWCVPCRRSFPWLNEMHA